MDDAARRGHRARDLRPRPGRRLLRRRHPGCARARGPASSVSRPLDTGQCLVGIVRSRRQPLFRRAGEPAVAGLHRAQLRETRSRSRSAGGPGITATPAPRSSPTHIRHRKGSRTDALARERTLGRGTRRIHPRLGQRPGRPRPTRNRAHLRPLGRCTRLAGSATGTPHSRRAWKATRHRSPDERVGQSSGGGAVGHGTRGREASHLRSGSGRRPREGHHMTATRSRIGFVGLGHMGGNMAERFLAAGYPVYGEERNREHAEPQVEQGLQWRDTAREVADAVEVVFTSLPDDRVLEQVASGPDGILAGLAAGKTWVDMSTVSPQASRDLAERVRAQGGVDARRARFRKRPAGAIGDADDHGRRRRGGLPSRRAAPARAGHADPHRRQRAGARAQARDQHQPRRADARVRRRVAPGRAVGRRPAARARRDGVRARSARRC